MVHGDIFNPDTRNVLALLEMVEANYSYKRINRNQLDEALPLTGVGVWTFANAMPVLERNGMKAIGSGSQMVELCCFEDQRNMPKRDANGKLIKVKKGTPPKKSLNPKELSEDIRKLQDWFLAKFRPYSQHLIHTVLQKPEQGIPAN